MHVDVQGSLLPNIGTSSTVFTISDIATGTGTAT
jgi:hypothetical protein